MSKKKKTVKDQTDAGFQGIEQALTKTEKFIEDNQKILTYSVLAIVAIVLIFILYKRFYAEPREYDAASELFMAEKFFERDSFAIALNGYGSYPGFLQIIDDYGNTKSANLAKYYAGLCYLNLKDYENAIEFLNKFKTNDLLIGSVKYASLGDAYSEKAEYEKAVKQYLYGADKYLNTFSTPILLKKAGLVYEELHNYEEALKIYKRIQKEYPESQEGEEINKYIERVKIKLGS